MRRPTLSRVIEPRNRGNYSLTTGFSQGKLFITGNGTPFATEIRKLTTENSNMIDLRSDTVTRPTAAMKQAMMDAEVGDDVIGDDPTVKKLEAMVADLLGKEAAIYMCSGTQSNQIGIRVNCVPGDELLINSTSHIGIFEAGAPAALSGVTVRQIDAPRGMLSVDDLEDKPRVDDQHFCRTRLVCLENTTNIAGGFVYSLEQLASVAGWARDTGLRLHLDGARFFNACVAGGYSPAELAAHFDTISICFSKGLGCPMGSILVGTSDDMHQARRARKMFGGSLRQTGLVAASAIYALENNVDRLQEDHDNAKQLAEGLAAIDGVSSSVEEQQNRISSSSKLTRNSAPPFSWPQLWQNAVCGSVQWAASVHERPLTWMSRPMIFKPRLML